MRELSFTKGHGTRNDFLLFTDPDDRITLSDAEVAYLCDRRAGIGADGILRAVRAVHVPQWQGDPELWFMDYRNSDGSVAEMCGNGLRVFTRYLIQAGLVGGPAVEVGTRAGLRTGTLLPDGWVAATMGPVVCSPESVVVRVGAQSFAGTPANVGNPHVVSILASADDLERLNLTESPGFPEGRFPQGVNAEFVALTGAGRLRMRVHERGSGETFSCGTGVVAAAVVAGQARPGGAAVRVTTRGGDLEVSLSADGEATLSGPAVLVAHGVVELAEGNDG